MASAQLRAGNYGRQSHGKATSVEDQIRAGDAACTDLGWVVHMRVRDTVSASRFGTKERDGWPELVAAVRGGQLDAVVMWDTSRGDRTPESWFGFLGLCRDRGVLLHSVRDHRTYDVRVARDWRTLAEDGVSAAYESEIRSADVRRGVVGAAAKGRPHGRAPYGYERIYDLHDRTQFTQRPDANASIVAEVIGRIARRDPVKAIVDDLNQRGVPAPSGRSWGRQSLRKVASNAAYAGLRSHLGELHKGNWSGIVDRKTWEGARAVLAEPDRKSAAPGALRWLLSYLVVGPHGLLNTQPARPSRPARYRCHFDSCTSVGMSEADEYVTGVILARLARRDARELFTANDAETTAALGELAAAEAEERELAAEARAGRLRPALLAAADAGVQERLRAAQGRVKAASGNAAALALIGDEEFSVETARPRWDALSIAARRSVITTLVDRVVLHPTGVRLTRWATDEERLALASERIEIVPKS